MARKNAAAVSLGRRRAQLAAPGELSELGKKGGKAGGTARARAMSPAERSEGASVAARARWAKVKKAKKDGAGKGKKAE